MKIKLLLVAIIPLLFMGCINDLFDEGDTLKSYDGPTVVGFFPTEQEVGVADGSEDVEIQLIGEQRSSDLAVSFSVSSESTAEAGVHYNITTSSPVTLSSGTSTVDVVVELIDGSLAAGEEVTLILTLEGGDGVDASVNQSTSTMFIRG